MSSISEGRKRFSKTDISTIITAWKDYLNDIKYCFRCLYNNKKTENEYTEKDEIALSSPDMKLHPLSESRKRSLVRQEYSWLEIEH